jgi:hypothetical protein
MSDRYILDNSHRPVPCEDLRTWARWMETADRVVAKTTVREGLDVSTVFLGLDHRFGPGTPLLFETMVFRDGDGGDEERYATWDEAVAGHQRLVELVTQEPVDA